MLILIGTVPNGLCAQSHDARTGCRHVRRGPAQAQTALSRTASAGPGRSARGGDGRGARARRDPQGVSALAALAEIDFKSSEPVPFDGQFPPVHGNIRTTCLE